jgi:hypothetical protein
MIDKYLSTIQAKESKKSSSERISPHYVAGTKTMQHLSASILG